MICASRTFKASTVMAPTCKHLICPNTFTYTACRFLPCSSLSTGRLSAAAGMLGSESEGREGSKEKEEEVEEGAFTRGGQKRGEGHKRTFFHLP